MVAMRIEIRKGNMKSVVIIKFSTTQRFDSQYERSKFFRSLHGWKQTVPASDAQGNRRQYVYRRKGLLDDIPHAKIADSVFLIAAEHMRRMEEFFSQWEDKVEWDMRNALMARRDIEEMMEI